MNWLVDLGVKVPVKTLDTVSVILITIILSYFTLIFGELVPKRLAMKKPEQLSLAMSGLISTISKFFAPLVWLPDGLRQRGPAPACTSIPRGTRTRSAKRRSG